ncbi:hypothetical protein GQ607_006083 [Colletotrichum asianum]|uniref:Uncharacterized protein n=1 Tax=Colletotrichum asianum TaxID=702518 RepID=A0A8H3WEZ0_9PEZI|nr:hypothetical protein GQ607_006083 [Colletotrichum asianum]
MEVEAATGYGEGTLLDEGGGAQRNPRLWSYRGVGSGAHQPARNGRTGRTRLKGDRRTIVGGAWMPRREVEGREDAVARVRDADEVEMLRAAPIRYRAELDATMRP